jgi:hypothetical protein
VLHARLHLLPLVDTVAYAALPQLVVVPCYREDPLDMLLGYNTPAEQLLDHAIGKVRLGIGRESGVLTRRDTCVGGKRV